MSLATRPPIHLLVAFVTTTRLAIAAVVAGTTGAATRPRLALGLGTGHDLRLVDAVQAYLALLVDL
jgi:hypothetical protein